MQSAPSKPEPQGQQKIVYVLGSYCKNRPMNSEDWALERFLNLRAPVCHRTNWACKPGRQTHRIRIRLWQDMSGASLWNIMRARTHEQNGFGRFRTPGQCQPRVCLCMLKESKSAGDAVSLVLGRKALGPLHHLLKLIPQEMLLPLH